MRIRATTFHAERRISPADIYSAKDRCPICGFSGTRPGRTVVRDNPEIELLLCPRCKGLSASDMPTQATLDQYYSDYYVNSSAYNKHEKLVTFYRPERMARHIVSHITVEPGEEYRIVDFGGGDGSIALSLAKIIGAKSPRNIRVQVVDYVKGQQRREGSISLEFVPTLDDAMTDCHLVIASAIFEHIPELGPVLNQAAAKLKPGGYLYARTPYILPFMRLLGVDMTYPGHVHDLGDAFWNTLPVWLDVPVECVRSAPSIVETGFRQNFLRTLAAYCLKFPARMSQNPRWKFFGGWEVILRRCAA